MTIKIPVEADVSGVLANIEKINAATKRVNDALSSGTIGLDAKEAEDDVKSLTAAVTELEKKLASAGKSGLGDVAGDAVKSIEAATQAATTMGQVLTQTGRNVDTAPYRRVEAELRRHDTLHQRAVRAQEVMTRERIRYSRVSHQSASDTEREFQRVAALGGAGSRSMRSAANHGEWFAENGGWRDSSLNLSTAQRIREQAAQRLGVQLPVSPVSPLQNIASVSPLQNIASRFSGKRIAGAAGGAMAGMMTGGGVGGAVGGAVGALASFLPGGAFLGPLLGGAAGAIGGKVGAAEDEGIAYTDLRHALGATSVEFDMLRGSVRQFSSGLGVTYNEAAKLAGQFAHVANLSEKDAMHIGREVSGAVGFGRGYGVDPEQSAQFFAQMRHYGVSGGEADNRKMAMMIADSVSKGGTSAKMDEVLGAIGAFASASARASLTSPNVAGYADMLSSLTGSSFAGMRGSPQNASGLIGKVDSAVRQGGAFGDASRSLMLAHFQNLYGDEFNVSDFDSINEQGVTGNANDAFRKGSPAYEAATAEGKAKYDRMRSRAGSGGDRTLLSHHMEAIQRQGGGNRDFERMTTRSHLGLSANEADVLLSTYREDNGQSFEKKLRDAGLDPKTLDYKSMSTLAPLANADRGALLKQAKRLGGMGMDAENTGKLSKAIDSGDDGKLKNEVLRLTAIYDKAKDEGERAREQRADMANSLQELATKLIPLTMLVKDGIIELVKWAAPNSEFAKREEAKRSEAIQRQTEAKKEIELYDGSVANLEKQIKSASPEAKPSLEAALAQVKEGRRKRVDMASTDAGKFDADEGYRNWLKSRGGDPLPMSVEAGAQPELMNPDGTKRVRNERNNNPGNIRFGEFAKRNGATGKDKDGFAIFPDKETGSAATRALLMSYQKQGINTLDGIVNKWAPPSENDTKSYVRAMSKRLSVAPDQPLDFSKDPDLLSRVAEGISAHEGSKDAYLKPKPTDVARAINGPAEAVAPSSGKSQSHGGPQSASFRGEFILRSAEDGRQLADPLIITRPGAPAHAGMAA